MSGKVFFSTENAAARVPVSARQFRRISRAAGVAPMKVRSAAVGGARRHMWTEAQIEAIRAWRAANLGRAEHLESEHELEQELELEKTGERSA